jgi:hypothetical protein
MTWEDLVNFGDLVFHTTLDAFYSLAYILENALNVFNIIIKPLTFIFNFIKGFFDGLATIPEELEIEYTFAENVMSVFETVPYFSLLVASIGAGLMMLLLSYLVGKLTKF